MDADGFEGLEDGGGGNCVEEDDEGFDRCDGLGEFGVGGKEFAICCDDTRRVRRAGKDSCVAGEAYSKSVFEGCLRIGRSVCAATLAA